MSDASSFLDSIVLRENAKWAPVDRSTELHARSVRAAILERPLQVVTMEYAYSSMPV